MNYEERCKIAQDLLPDAEYKNSLTRLHDEMLKELNTLRFYKEHRTCMGCWGEIHQCGCGEVEE